MMTTSRIGRDNARRNQGDAGPASQAAEPPPPPVFPPTSSPPVTLHSETTEPHVTQAPRRLFGDGDDNEGDRPSIPASSLPPDLVSAMRQIAIDAVTRLVDERIDIRLALFREDIMDQVKQATVRIHDQTSRTVRDGTGVNSAPLEISTRQAPVQALDTRPTADADVQKKLELTRLQLRLEKQKVAALSDRVSGLEGIRNAGPTPQRLDRDDLAMTGVPHTPKPFRTSPEEQFEPTPVAPTLAATGHPQGDTRFTFPLGPRSSIHNIPFTSPSRAPSLTPALGPPHFGLEDIRPANPDSKDVVSYRRYRLDNTNADTGTTVSRYVGHYVRTFQPTLESRKFDGATPIAILDFLSSFKRVCNEHAVSEGLALLILPHFLLDDARKLIEESFELSGEGFGGYQCWPEAIQLLLMNYAKDHFIKEAIDKFRNCRMREDEDENSFGRRLRSHARLCGGVITPQQLITRFYDGLPAYVRPTVTEVIPHLPTFNAYQTWPSSTEICSTSCQAFFSTFWITN